METTTSANFKDIEINKDYFAAYLNMARHNVFITLSHLNKRYFPDSKNVEKESKLSEMDIIEKLDNPKLINIQSITYQLEKHFPFLLPAFNKALKNNHSPNNGLENIQPVEFKSILTIFLSHLNDLRNYFTHVKHENIKIEPKLFKYLDSIFDSAVLKAKKNNSYTDAELNHLIPNIFTNKNGIKEKSENPKFKFKFKKNNEEFSNEGLAFFICMFLEKQYISEFLGKIKNFKNRNERCFRATIDSYMAYTIDVPFDRIESTQSDFALGLDMLNDLKRCPQVLFEQLSPQNQQLFRIKMNSDDSEPETEAENLQDVFPDTFWQKRTSRFNYFALSYLDKMNILPNLRFQVDLGVYFYKFYPKTTLDGLTNQRNIGFRIKAFGKPNELNTLRFIKWKNIIVSNPPENFDNEHLTDTYPHYHFVNNQIAISFSDDRNVPELQQSFTQLKQPDAWLSEYEILGMMFYSYLLKHYKYENHTDNKKFDHTEDIIINYTKRIKKLFELISENKIKACSNENEAQQLLNQYQIELVNLPDEIRNYLSGKAIDYNDIYNAYCNRILELLKYQTIRKIESIKLKIKKVMDKSNKPGKKKFEQLKFGGIADFLAKDMLMFQPSVSKDKDNQKDGRDKITSANFKILQLHLAFFGRDREILNSLFSSCGLTTGNNQHPFLHTLNPLKYKGIVDFYIAYLEKRNNFLEKCITEKHFDEYYFLKPWKKREKEDKQYITTLTQRYLNLPINLPRGLYLDAIKNWFAEYGSKSMKELVQNSERVNTIFLLQKYIETEEKDSSQVFYTFKRSYKVFDKLINKKSGNKLTHNYLTTKELTSQSALWKPQIKNLPIAPKPPKSFDKNLYYEPMLKLWNEYNDNEKTLRLIKAQDMMQFLLAKDILLSKKDDSINLSLDSSDFKLNKIEPNSEKGPLAAIVPCQIKVHDKIIEHQVKIKNYGNFVKLTRDRRLQSLFKYFNNNNISYNIIEKELKVYNVSRLNVSFQLHRFEKAMLDKYGLGQELKMQQKRNNKYKLLNIRN
jgi:hypothetical protein